MPPADDGKRKAARETIDILYDISTLLVRVISLLMSMSGPVAVLRHVTSHLYLSFSVLSLTAGTLHLTVAHSRLPHPDRALSFTSVFVKKQK